MEDSEVSLNSPEVSLDENSARNLDEHSEHDALSRYSFTAIDHINEMYEEIGKNLRKKTQQEILLSEEKEAEAEKETKAEDERRGNTCILSAPAPPAASVDELLVERHNWNSSHNSSSADTIREIPILQEDEKSAPSETSFFCNIEIKKAKELAKEAIEKAKLSSGKVLDELLEKSPEQFLKETLEEKRDETLGENVEKIFEQTPNDDILDETTDERLMQKIAEFQNEMKEIQARFKKSGKQKHINEEHERFNAKLSLQHSVSSPEMNELVRDFAQKDDDDIEEKDETLQSIESMLSLIDTSTVEQTLTRPDSDISKDKSQNKENILSNEKEISNENIIEEWIRNASSNKTTNKNKATQVKRRYSRLKRDTRQPIPFFYSNIFFAVLAPNSIFGKSSEHELDNQ